VNQALEIAAENALYCSNWGMPAGSAEQRGPDSAECDDDLTGEPAIILIPEST